MSALNRLSTAQKGWLVFGVVIFVLAIRGCPSSETADQNAIKVSKGFMSGSFLVEISPEIASEIVVSDLKWEEWGVNFKLHWRGSTKGRSRDPWHFSAFDKEGVKIDGGAVKIPNSMDLGQKVKARMTLRRENEAELARIVIHR